MKSHIEIILTGDAIPTMLPIGAQVTYGINMIPTASISLGPEHLNLICDFEAIRRTNATLSIKTVNGCLYFDGLIDGLSFNQSVGNIGATLMLKSKFHVLTEMYSRWPGFHPATTNPFVRIDTVDYSPDDVNNLVLSRIQAFGEIPDDAYDKPFPEFIKQVAIAKMKAYQALFFVEGRGLILEEMSKLVNNTGQAKLAKAIELLTAVDTEAVGGALFYPSDQRFVNTIVEVITKSDGNLLEDFMRQLSVFKMNIVFGNNKAYVIPDGGYLRMPHNFSIPRGAQSNTVNVAFPAQYDSINFSDGGYKDIKAVYLVAEQNSDAIGGYSTTELGSYIDTDPMSKGGVLAIELPQYLPTAVDTYSTDYSNEMRRNIMGRSSSMRVQQFLYPEIKDKKEREQAEMDSKNRALKEELYNNWAQLEYLNVKYADRVGGLNLFFNPNWAPGCVGTLYTRLPGTYIDFLVQQVTHSFSISAPNAGSATTSVSFSCGRYGNRVDGAGVDKIYFYDYDIDVAQTFAKKFIGNVTT